MHTIQRRTKNGTTYSNIFVHATYQVDLFYPPFFTPPWNGDTCRYCRDIVKSVYLLGRATWSSFKLYVNLANPRGSQCVLADGTPAKGHRNQLESLVRLLANSFLRVPPYPIASFVSLKNICQLKTNVTKPAYCALSSPYPSVPRCPPPTLRMDKQCARYVTAVLP